MATTSDISRGSFLRYNNELLNVLEYDHITPGKGNAIYSVKCRNVETGKQSEIRFRSGEKVDIIRVDEFDMQYLFTEGDSLVCMNTENYEQINIPSIIFGDAIKYLQEGMILTIRFDDNEKPLSGNLPKYIDLIVIYTEEGIKGKSSKPAEVEGGIIIQVPIFVNVGDKLKINIADNEYVERVMS